MKRIILSLTISFAVTMVGQSFANNFSAHTVPTKVKLNETDTVINSLPVNYLKDLEFVPPSQKIDIRSYKEVLELFETLNYTPKAWQEGIREVPRVYFTRIGERWGSTTTKEITVKYKKQIFFRGIAPLILLSNEMILKDRNRLEIIKLSFSKNSNLSEPDKNWAFKLAELYKVKTEGNQVTETTIEELWKRVDIIPPSLAMSQAAVESGWGTSRFAASGNALYGQWTWGKKAMIPEEQRKGLGNYGIAAFESLLESVCAYMLNLNTHNAYSKLRDKRAEFSKNGEQIKGYVLAEQLDKYSERGETYVKELQSLMNYNHLNPVDDAFLSDSPPVYLIPVQD
ncbi:MAG: glucosaminidase domain-containing protein [Bacteroidota bacterium]